MKTKALFSFIFILILTVCNTESGNSAETVGKGQDSHVFPAAPSSTENLIVYPVGSHDYLSNFGDPVDPYIEKIVQNALRYNQAEEFSKAEKLYTFALHAASDRGLTFSREQLSVILGQRAYALADSGRPEESIYLWAYQIHLWMNDDEWRDVLPEGLRITTEESEEQIGFYQANSYAEHALNSTVIKKYSEVLDEMEKSSEIFSEFGYTDKAIDFFLLVINNLFIHEEYALIIEANPIVIDLMMNSPGNAAIEDILSMGRFTAISAMNLGDYRTAYQIALGNVNLAETTGYHDQYTVLDRQLMEEFKKNISSADDENISTLSAAIAADDEKAVERLLNAGADPNERVNDVTPLMLLCHNSGSVSIADLLLEAGADPNATGVSNITALIIAAGYTDNLPLVLRLLEAGADVNQLSPQGWNALMLAVRRNTSPEIIKALLENGADADAVTVDGVTALVLAESMNNPEITRMIRDASGTD